MEAPVLMVAQTVPTSAQYIDKLTTVGTCSASRENEATRTSDCSPCFHVSATEPHNVDVPEQLQETGEGSEGYLTINVSSSSLPQMLVKLLRKSWTIFAETKTGISIQISSINSKLNFYIQVFVVILEFELNPTFKAAKAKSSFSF